jgi:aminocarboxymuconate-semialdehyde decarboxylase
LRRFYYDTIGYSDSVLHYLVKEVGADRLMMGSDYCFPIAYEQPVEIVTSISLEPEQELAILEGNAKRLLKISNK